MGKSYPDNTFLFYPEDRYGDFTNTYRYAETEAPYRYSGGGANYFPATFLIFDVFGWLPPVPATILFLGLCSAGLFVVLEAALRSAVPHPGWRVLSCTVFLWTFPVLLCLDRGNTELLLVALVAASLFFYSRKKFALSFLFLLLPICFKLFPALLLLLFFRPRLFHWFFAGILGFALVSWLALLTMQGTVTENFASLLNQMAIYNKVGVLSYNGIAGSASAWNSFRILTWLYYYHSHQSPEYVGQLPLPVAHNALMVYDGFVLAGLILLTLYVLFVETSFARRLVLLLLFMTVSAPGAGDYKLMYVDIALVTLVLIPDRRPWDLVVTCLLAVCLLPKRECILHFMGVSDSGRYDATIGVILNPLCMLFSMALLVWSGWTVLRPLRLKQRFWKLLSLFRFAGLRPLWVKQRPVVQVTRPRRSRPARKR